MVIKEKVMEVMHPNKESLEAINEILAQHRMIIEINKMISQMILQPALILNEAERGKNWFKIPEAGEILHK